MVETIAQVFGMAFVGIIVICIAITLVSYIFEAHTPDNKLEENIKKFNKKRGI